ncbi:MAG: hypothetical protein M3Z92_15775 [Bacteroidota bacterium]|nr:hypothetical protein [Bacteroidota bacterium]
MAVAKEGLDNIEHVLNEKSTCCTLFTTSNFARAFPDEIGVLSKIMKMLLKHFTIHLSGGIPRMKKIDGGG